MDMLVVAAAAGAGYLATYWQNLSRDKDSLSELPSGGSDFEKPELLPSTQQLSDGSCPLQRLAQRKKLSGDVSTERGKVSDANYSEKSQSDGALASEGACTGRFVSESLVNLGNDEDCTLFSLSAGLLRSDNLLGNGDECRVNGDIGDCSGDLLTEPYIKEVGSFLGSSRKRSSLRTMHSCGHSVKPLSSLESCLMAQLYKDHVKMEEYVLSSLPLPSAPTVRPFLVADRSRIISRANGECFSSQIGMEEKKQRKEPYSKEKETTFGLPPLPHIGSADLPRKLKLKTEKGRGGRLSSSTKMVNGKNLNSRGGSADRMLLFCLGFSIGILSSVVVNKKEVDKLKELLKQTENLVEDLQEELEMKDSLTVKELADENNESEDTSDHSFHSRASNDFSPQLDMNELTVCDAKEPYDPKAGENSESISKIEAELEAELERLELNISASSLKRRVSGLVEVDPDFVAEFTEGELRADVVGGQAGALPESDEDTSGTSTTHSANYAVSPRELSLRLHEVIQSRLEERIKELETALQNSQQKHLMESECMNSSRDFSNSELESSSAHESPIAMEKHSSISQPLVINLSEEALDAYNEAYEQLTKINESEEEDLLPGLGKKNGGNSCMPHCTINKDKNLRKCMPLNVRTSEEYISRVQTFNGFGIGGDENSDCDDEMEKLLIQQIVEKTRKGSPAVLNAQRAFISNDINMH